MVPNIKIILGYKYLGRIIINDMLLNKSKQQINNLLKRISSKCILQDFIQYNRFMNEYKKNKIINTTLSKKSLMKLKKILIAWQLFI